MNKYQEYRQTNNSSVYRKLHKYHHASCSFCKWHSPTSENDAWKYYYKDDKKHRFPSWKLVSKNKKQWMKKSLKFKKLKWFKNRFEIIWYIKIKSK